MLDGGSRPTYTPGWCNGTAGMVSLWTVAARVMRDPVYDDLADRSAWHTWESGGGGADLCCGDAGAAYAFLARYQTTGDVAWLRRATSRAERAVRAMRRGRPQFRALIDPLPSPNLRDPPRPQRLALCFTAEETEGREGKTTKLCCAALRTVARGLPHIRRTDDRDREIKNPSLWKARGYPDQREGGSLCCRLVSSRRACIQSSMSMTLKATRHWPSFTARGNCPELCILQRC